MRSSIPISRYHLSPAVCSLTLCSNRFLPGVAIIYCLLFVVVVCASVYRGVAAKSLCNKMSFDFSTPGDLDNEVNIVRDRGSHGDH